MTEQEELTPTRKAALLASQLMGGDLPTRAKAQQEIEEALSRVEELEGAIDRDELERVAHELGAVGLPGGLPQRDDHAVQAACKYLRKLRSALTHSIPPRREDMSEHKIPTYANPIKFEYTNWRGQLHTYVIQPESVALGPYRGETHMWVLHGDVITRDCDPREDMEDRRRTFILEHIRNPRTPGPEESA